MLKIKIEKTKTSILENSEIQAFLKLPTINENKKHNFKQYISFGQIQEMVVNLSEGYNTAILCVLNQEDFTDLLTEQAALLFYDSSYKNVFGFDIYFKTKRGTLIILGSDTVKKENALFLQTDRPEELQDQKITFKTEFVEYEETKDFSKVQFKIIHATKYSGDAI